MVSTLALTISGGHVGMALDERPLQNELWIVEDDRIRRRM